MTETHRKSLADQLSALAFNVESGGGESALLFSAAERLDSLEKSIHASRQLALYLQTTLAHIDALLRGDQIDPYRFVDDPLAEAKTRAATALKVAEKYKLLD